MKVKASDKYLNNVEVSVSLFNGDSIKVSIKTDDMNEVIKSSDFITLHVPAQKDYVVEKEEFAMMKDGSEQLLMLLEGVSLTKQHWSTL